VNGEDREGGGGRGGEGGGGGRGGAGGGAGGRRGGLGGGGGGRGGRGGEGGPYKGETVYEAILVSNNALLLPEVIDFRLYYCRSSELISV
jgi:Predicted membrane protein